MKPATLRFIILRHGFSLLAETPPHIHELYYVTEYLLCEPMDVSTNATPAFTGSSEKLINENLA